MHRMQAFKTRDGKLFDSEAEAARHEANIKMREWAARRKIGADGSVAWDKVAEAMIEDAAELAYLFISLARALPKNDGPVDMGGVIPLRGEEGTLWPSKHPVRNAR